jgi:hypothetical protein
MGLDCSENTMNIFGRKLPDIPFRVKKGKFFIRYKQKWFNVNLEVSVRGGGFKGLKSFIRGINNCRKGNHSYTTVFYVRSLTSRIECKYCRLEKKNNKDK